MFALLTKGSIEKEIPQFQNIIQIDRGKFVENLNSTVEGEQVHQDSDLSAKELESAEIALLRSVQGES